MNRRLFGSDVVGGITVRHLFASPLNRAGFSGNTAVNSVGISLFFRNGMPSLTLLATSHSTARVVIVRPRRFRPPTTHCMLIGRGFSSLDWTGVAMVEEEWRPSTTAFGNGFYRAAWMNRPASFDADRRRRRDLGPPWWRTGKDDQFLPSDDGFVRRFVVRQIAADAAIGNARAPDSPCGVSCSFATPCIPANAQSAAATKLPRVVGAAGHDANRRGDASNPSDFDFGYGRFNSVGQCPGQRPVLPTR